jgi:hypothetical protein
MAAIPLDTPLGYPGDRTSARQRLAAGRVEPGRGLGGPAGRPGRWRSPRRGWAICGTPCTVPMTHSGFRKPPGRTRCSGSSCWPRSPGRRASRTPCGSRGKRAPARRPIPRSTARLRAYAKESWRQGLSGACAAHAALGPASLVPCDVSTAHKKQESRPAQRVGFLGNGVPAVSYSPTRPPSQYHRR